MFDPIVCRQRSSLPDRLVWFGLATIIFSTPFPLEAVAIVKYGGATVVAGSQHMGAAGCGGDVERI